MKYEYTYRELSELFGINLAKLKRWGREFLPPDLSAGQQQGVPRKLTLDDAYFLYFSGVLVQEIGFSIPEVRKIKQEVEPFLRERGLIPSQRTHLNTMKSKAWFISVTRYETGDFHYTMRGIISRSYEAIEDFTINQAGKKIKISGDLVTEKYITSFSIPMLYSPPPEPQHGMRTVSLDSYNIKSVPVTFLLYGFLMRLGIDLFNGEPPPMEIFPRSG